MYKYTRASEVKRKSKNGNFRGEERESVIKSGYRFSCGVRVHSSLGVFLLWNSSYRCSSHRRSSFETQPMGTAPLECAGKSKELERTCQNLT